MVIGHTEDGVRGWGDGSAGEVLTWVPCQKPCKNARCDGEPLSSISMAGEEADIGGPLGKTGEPV